MTRRPSRLAFTLIELIVVIAIMIVVMVIGTAVAYSGAFNSQKVVSAGDRASGWLVIAKNRAMRDGVPRGVRFIRNPPSHPTAPNAVTEAQYIEQPDEWAPNPDQEFNPHGPRIIHSYQFPEAAEPNIKYVYFVSFDPTLPSAATHPQNIARQADILEFDQRIFPGDQLLMPEIGGPYRITAIAAPTPSSPDRRLQLNDQFLPTPVSPVVVPPENCRILTLVTVNYPAHYPALGAAHSLPVDPAAMPIPRLNPLGTLTTYKYAFQPKPLPLRGEPLLQLTGTTIIDYQDAPYSLANPQTTLGVSMLTEPFVGQYFDIMFAPSGQVLNNPNGIICLWVRDPEKLSGNPRLPTDAQGYDLAGEQILVTIYTRTGFIATHPVSALTATGDPWANAKDGANSGF